MGKDDGSLGLDPESYQLLKSAYRKVDRAVYLVPGRIDHRHARNFADPSLSLPSSESASATDWPVPAGYGVMDQCRAGRSC